jgi:hypothetical protein
MGRREEGGMRMSRGRQYKSIIKSRRKGMIKEGELM